MPPQSTCATRLTRPPLVLAWTILGTCASVPLVLLSFFDWTARGVGAVRFDQVISGFSRTPTLTLPQWFQLVLVIAWGVLVLVELCTIAALACQHGHVMALYRTAVADDDDEEEEHAAAAGGEDEETGVAAADAAARRRQQAHEAAEDALVRAGRRRHLACRVASVWVARGAVSVAAQVFNALGISAAPAGNALLVRTVVACLGAVALVQLA